MKKFDRRVTIGTKVKINESIYTVEKVVNGGTHIKVKELAGHFQVGHIDGFSNIKKRI